MNKMYKNIGTYEIETDNTNSKHLELYSVMAEHDNAGFPLSYCLLSTATAIDQRKRTKALTAWAKCLKNNYSVNPTFVHVDKDMAEIGMVIDVWSAKVSLCWWHLRRAVRTQLANGKLSTTPYNVTRAHSEFSFISPDFKPMGNTDKREYEGGEHAQTDSCKNVPIAASEATTSKPTNTMAPPSTALTPLAPSATAPSGSSIPISATIPTLTNSLNTLSIRLPQRTVSRNQPGVLITPTGKENRIDLSALVKTKGGTQKKLTIRLLPPQQPKEGLATTTAAAKGGAETDEESETEEPAKRRTFCPAIHRDDIIDMMEAHYCAHPLIPGYAPPNPDGIRKWAVQKVYNYCFNNTLPEVWAYLWENWYRRGRWELWARSAHSMIPILKTTMILESQCVSLCTSIVIILLILTLPAGDVSNMIFSTTFTCHAVISSSGF